MTFEPRLRGATQEIAAVARAVAGPPDPRVLDATLARVRIRVEQHRAARGKRRAAWGALIAAAAVLLAVTWRTVAAHRTPEPLVYRVTGAEPLRDGYVRARSGERPRLAFSEGSVVVLAADARMRVVSVDERGGRLAIEEGEVRADIMHRAGARWTFDAGPYSVEVRGTSFSLAWRGADGWLDLRLQTGLLAIHTPWSPAPIVIHGGQRLTVRAADHQTTIADLGEMSDRAEAPVAPATSASAAVPAPPAAQPVVTAGSPNTSALKPPASWSARMASGALQSIVDEALERGLETTLRERTSDDLAVLETAARYQKRPDIARRALLAQRSRFAGSPRAKEAAFLLGRLAETGDGVAAHEWYERYLSEAPNGAFAAEATGRNMVVSNRIFGVERGRRLAEAYLKRWPTGAHAQLARSILDHP